MREEKRMLGNYEVVNSIYIGDKEVVFGVDKSDKYPFLVSYCDCHNPLGVPWATESVGCDDYLEAMELFIQRVQSQIEQTKSELSKFQYRVHERALYSRQTQQQYCRQGCRYQCRADTV